jgi:hypothetical protein
MPNSERYLPSAPYRWDSRRNPGALRGALVAAEDRTIVLNKTNRPMTLPPSRWLYLLGIAKSNSCSIVFARFLGRERVRQDPSGTMRELAAPSGARPVYFCGRSSPWQVWRLHRAGRRDILVSSAPRPAEPIPLSRLLGSLERGASHLPSASLCLRLQLESVSARMATLQWATIPPESNP